MIRVHSKHGNFIALLPDNLEGGFAVVVTAWGVESFAGNWPCANLPDRPVRFEFDSAGNLVGHPRYERPAMSEPRLIARWESRSGKHWVELSATPYGDSTTPYQGVSWGYRSPGAGGGLAATNDADAIAEMQAKIDTGWFQPDAAKTPMKRVFTAPSLRKWHKVTPEDSARIQCQDCGKPAYACEHAEWNTGNTSGISFWYYCHPCAIKRSGNGLLADCMEVKA